MNFPAPLSHIFLKVLLKEVDRRTQNADGSLQMRGEKLWLALSGVKGQDGGRDRVPTQRAAVLLTPNQAIEKQFALSNENGKNSGSMSFSC